MPRYTTKTPEEIHAIAQGILSDQIFTNLHIRPGDENLIGNIFMPMLFLDETSFQDLRSNPPGLVYADMADAGPRAINGYPMFTNMKMLSKDDAKRVFDRVKQITDLRSSLPPA